MYVRSWYWKSKATFNRTRSRFTSGNTSSVLLLFAQVRTSWSILYAKPLLHHFLNHAAPFAHALQYLQVVCSCKRLTDKITLHIKQLHNEYLLVDTEHVQPKLLWSTGAKTQDLTGFPVVALGCWQQDLWDRASVNWEYSTILRDCWSDFDVGNLGSFFPLQLFLSTLYVWQGVLSCCWLQGFAWRSLTMLTWVVHVTYTWILKITADHCTVTRWRMSLISPAMLWLINGPVWI